MCRFVLYMGAPITLDLLTTRPVYSIINQSYRARMRSEPLNGDGFGIAWYVPELSPEPAQYRSIRPAWNNVNLIHLARVSRSPVVMAHVRAATRGMGVSESNCHPFAAERFAFMHNGTIADFLKIKRPLRERLTDASYLTIHGTTDSEHLFALFRDHVKRGRNHDPAARMAHALEATIHEVEELACSRGVLQDSLLNMAVTDGQCAAVSRYATGAGVAPTLYYQTGTQYECVDGVCRMRTEGEGERTVIVASEPLTDDAHWTEVPPSHMVLVDCNRNITLQSLK